MSKRLKISIVCCIIVFLAIGIFYHTHSKKNNTIGPEGITRYQIIPDKWANGDTKNDYATPPLERQEIAGNSAYTNEVSSRTGDWFQLSSGEQTVYNKLLALKRDPKKAFGFILRFRRYGGDFQGIRDHMNYLKDLGIGGILLNPIWLANSPMRYDAIDYRHIDPRLSSYSDNYKDKFGTGREWTKADIDFMNLVNEFHTQGMKVTVDLAFTYSAAKSIFLEDIARHGKASPYYTRFELLYEGEAHYNEKTCMLSNFFPGDEYKEAKKIRMNGRWGSCSLVYINRAHDKNLAGDLEKWYIAIIDRRMKPQIIDGKQYDGVDGIRLDAVTELTPEFTTNLYKHIKAIKPDAIIFGEDRSNNFSLINMKAIDGLVNYFTRTLGELFFIQKDKALYSGSTFNDLIDQEYGGDNRNKWSYTLNQLGSHDTDRILSKLVDTNRVIKNKYKVRDYHLRIIGHYLWDSREMNTVSLGANYIESKAAEKDLQLRRTLSMLQFMLPGEPSIYYGDEIGMRGADDPDNRKPMRWPNYNFQVQSTCAHDDKLYCSVNSPKENIVSYPSILTDYKKLIALRKTSTALQKGEISTDIDMDKGADKGIFSILRSWNNEKVYFISNQNTGYVDMNISLDTKSPLSTWHDPLTDKSYRANILGKIEISLPAEGSVILVSK